MREIKFRFWDSFNECYTYSKDSLYGFFNLYEATLEGENNPILEQFTGLKDRNGKEIYEGDIVEYKLNHDSSQKIIKSIIEWHKFAWRLNRLWLLTEIRTITVNGNIHENPDLL